MKLFYLQQLKWNGPTSGQSPWLLGVCGLCNDAIRSSDYAALGLVDDDQ
jgi:hypothetical protein